MNNELGIKESKHIHFVGIKGVGLANLAILAKQKGIKVTGSDVAEVFVTDEVLRENDIGWQVGFSPENISGRPDLVVATAAHGGMTNPEVLAAKERGLTVVTYAQALGMFMEGKEGVSVCGVGGKGSTAALLSSVLTQAGWDPSYIIGVARINPLGCGGHHGVGKYFVAEADDYVACPLTDPTPKFMYQSPRVIIVTNIEYDHPDVYPNFAATKKAFGRFFNKLPKDGFLVANIDNAGVLEVLREFRGRVVTYGFSRQADCSIEDLKIKPGEISFYLADIGGVKLHLPGRYNVLNATAAAVAARQLGVKGEDITEGLGAFRGIGRRFEHIGKVIGVDLYDDYAHHPQEIENLITAAREWLTGRRLVLIFQPHTFSRTRALFQEFTAALAKADVILLPKIYASAREAFDQTVSSAGLAEVISKVNPKTFSCPEKEDVLKMLGKVIKKGDVVFTVGAGDIFLWHREILGVLGR